jgi:PIN domain nuclease of toxin-antitoxin system
VTFVFSCPELPAADAKLNPGRAVTLRDLTELESLPWHHRDPFDRLMAAQAIQRGLQVVSSDPIFEEYGVDRIW